MKKTIKTVFNTISVMAILFVLFTNLGVIKSFIGKRIPRTFAEPKSVPVMNYNLEKEIIQAMDTAHAAAYQYTSHELDKWINDMMSRADNEFLDDYFGFMQTKRRELLSIYNSAIHFIRKDTESAEEVAIRELENEISRKVIKPELAQARIENITCQALDVYMTTFDNELVKLQESYKIPTPDWNKYISALCGLTLDTEQKSYPIAFKTAVVSGTAMTGIIAVPVIKSVATKVSSKIAEKAAVKAGTKAAEKVVVKTGTKVAVKGVGTAAKAIPYIGWGITAAICIWDIVDYANTSSEGKKLLKTSLEEYFAEIKTEMLGNNESSIMGAITLWENALKARIAKA